MKILEANILKIIQDANGKIILSSLIGKMTFTIQKYLYFVWE